MGDNVSEVWSALLRPQDRFVALDSALFLNEDITSPEYTLRYAPDVVLDEASLLVRTGAEELSDVENLLYCDDEFDGDLMRTEDGVELQLGRVGYGLSYPFTISLLHRTARRLQKEYELDMAGDDEP